MIATRPIQEHLLTGTLISILCSLVWSIAIIMFKKSGDDVHPILLNLLKNCVGLVLFIPTVFIVDGFHLPSLTGSQWWILTISGMIGIGAADAMVLKALKQAGASRLAIAECAYSPCVILLSWIFLGEALTLPRFFGAVLVIVAILCVCITKESLSATGGKVLSGMVWGSVGIMTMAIGIVMIKPLFSTVPLFWIITIRLAAGVVASAAVFAGVRQKRKVIQVLCQQSHKGLIFVACVLSTYVSMILWVAGYKYNDAALAAVLNQTSTIFTVILAAVILKEQFTPLKAVGTVLATSGVMIMALL